jgi:hypothetical protein
MAFHDERTPSRHLACIFRIRFSSSSMNVAFCFACAAINCCGVIVAPPPAPDAARSASLASWATRRFRSARTSRIISKRRCVYVSCLSLWTVGSTPFTSKESRGRIRRISGFRPCRRHASADRGVSTIFDGGGLRSADFVLDTLSHISSMVWAFCANTLRLPRPLPILCWSRRWRYAAGFPLPARSKGFGKTVRGSPSARSRATRLLRDAQHDER